MTNKQILLAVAVAVVGLYLWKRYKIGQLDPAGVLATDAQNSAVPSIAERLGTDLGAAVHAVPNAAGSVVNTVNVTMPPA
jgi:hypothetical protein